MVLGLIHQSLFCQNDIGFVKTKVSRNTKTHCIHQLLTYTYLYRFCMGGLDSIVNYKCCKNKEIVCHKQTSLYTNTYIVLARAIEATGSYCYWCIISKNIFENAQ